MKALLTGDSVLVINVTNYRLTREVMISENEKIKDKENSTKVLLSKISKKNCQLTNNFLLIIFVIFSDLSTE